MKVQLVLLAALFCCTIDAVPYHSIELESGTLWTTPDTGLLARTLFKANGEANYLKLSCVREGSSSHTEAALDDDKCPVAGCVCTGHKERHFVGPAGFCKVYREAFGTCGLPPPPVFCKVRASKDFEPCP